MSSFRVLAVKDGTPVEFGYEGASTREVARQAAEDHPDVRVQHVTREGRRLPAVDREEGVRRRDKPDSGGERQGKAAA